MASIRELNSKVSSLRNMQKVMRAMNMIASSKLRKIMGRLAALQAFEKSTKAMARDLAMTFRKDGGPLLGASEPLQRVCLVLFTADKGLCGSHNNTVYRAAGTLLESFRKRDIEVDIACIGTRGAVFCRRNNLESCLTVRSAERTLTDKALREVAGTLADRVKNGEVQEVHMVYNTFISALQQQITTQQLLPLSGYLPKDVPLPEDDVFASCEATPEASARLIEFLLLQVALRHSHLSEHASRMTAMDNATNNSEDLISRYGAVRNRLRQTRITNDLTEIVAGKEALED